MDIHQNARLTPYSREQLAKFVLSQVSGKTARKWGRRYQTENRAGMADRSSRPHRLWRPTSPAVVAQVEHLRRQRFHGDSHRPANRTQPCHRQPHSVPPGHCSPARPRTRSPHHPLRTRRARRPASPRYQAAGPLPRCRLSSRWSSSRRQPGRWLGPRSRRHRRSLPHCLRPHPPRPDRPTTATATARVPLPWPVSNCSYATTSLALTLRVPMARPSASSRPPCASGLMPRLIPTPMCAMPNCRAGCITTTGTAPMLV